MSQAIAFALFTVHLLLSTAVQRPPPTDRDPPIPLNPEAWIIHEGDREGQIQRRFTQSSRSVLLVSITEIVDHRVHRENLEDLSAASVRGLGDLCAKLLAWPSGKIMNNPG